MILSVNLIENNMQGRTEFNPTKNKEWRTTMKNNVIVIGGPTASREK